MVGVIVNPKSEVLRLSSTRFRRLPLWASCYDITVQICELAEKHPDRETEIMRELVRSALKVPSTLAKCSGYKLGRNYVSNLRQSCIATRELALLILVCYELDHIKAETFTDLNSKLGMFSKKLFRYTKNSQRKLNRNRRKMIRKS